MIKLKNLLTEDIFDRLSRDEKELIYNTIESPEFISWFGDSKVVDSRGNPLVVYHGGTVEDKFDSSFISKTSGMRDYGFSFTTNKTIAKLYAKYSRGNINKYFLKIEDLIEYDAEHKFAHDAKWKFSGKSWNMFDLQEFHRYGKTIYPYTETAKTTIFKKADGIVFKNINEEDSGAYPGDTYIVFDPENIWKIK